MLGRDAKQKHDVRIGLETATVMLICDPSVWPAQGASVDLGPDESVSSVVHTSWDQQGFGFRWVGGRYWAAAHPARGSAIRGWLVWWIRCAGTNCRYLNQERCRPFAVE